MKWYDIDEKLPKNRSLVAIWYRKGSAPSVDNKYIKTVYSTYKIVFY